MKYLPALVLAACLACQNLFAQTGVPGIITYQGRVTVAGQPYTGTGLFKFALVDGGVNSSRQAYAFATSDPGGSIMTVTITDGGAGYLTPPEVSFSSPSGGSGASATAIVAMPAAMGAGGAVTSITLNNPGSGYGSTPFVTIAPPPVYLANFVSYWSHDGTSLSGNAPFASWLEVPVKNGLFTVALGDTNVPNMIALPPEVLTNTDVHLRIWFDVGEDQYKDGGVHFEQLTPDQPLTAAPYALVAQKAMQLEGTSTGPVTLNNSGNSFSGNGAGLTAVNASTLGGLAVSNFWKLGGNAGTTANNFLGTTDNQPLELRVNGQPALRLGTNGSVSLGQVATASGINATAIGQLSAASAAESLALGYTATASGISSTAMGFGSTARGVDSTAIGYAAMAYGYASIAMGPGTSALGVFSTAIGYSTTASGTNSTAMGIGTTASGDYSIAMGIGTTASGYASTAMGAETSASGNFSTAMGYNTTANGYGSTAMGSSNLAFGTYATSMGGFTSATGYASTAMGVSTTASGDSSTAMGNGTTASGGNSTAMGIDTTANGFVSTAIGASTTASGYASFAGGNHAFAAGAGSFVWSSYENRNVTIGSSQFSVFGQHGFNVDYSTQRLDGGGSRWVYLGDNISGQTIATWTGAYLSDSGVWQNVSDKNRKTDFAMINASEILAKLAALPVQQWRYTNESSSVTHIGPTAQEFKAAFNLGTDDKSIGTVDESGVALAAIQGLNQKLEEQAKEKDAEITALKARLENLEQVIGTLTGGAK